jgi:hypothetical protein
MNLFLFKEDVTMKRFAAAYGIAKFYEVLGWVVMAAGIVGAIIAADTLEIGGVIGAVVGSIIFGLMIIFNAQLVLVVLSTENNTYHTLEELTQTNQMLQETLGKMTVNLQKMAEKDK